MAVDIKIPSLGDKFQDYRKDISGDSFNFGPVINASKVKLFAFHHSVTAQTAKNDGNWKSECNFIANIHIEKRGWAGVGYRFIICSDGTVAYVGDLSHGGAAVTNNNDLIISACFVGDFTKQLPTAAQVHSANLLAKHFLENSPQYPLIKSWDQVIGHQEAFTRQKELGLASIPSGTACPGSNWKAGGDTLFDRVKNDRWDGYPDPKPGSVPQPEPTPTPEPDCEKRIQGLTARNTDLSNQLATANQELKNREDQVSRLKQQVLDEQQLNKTLQANRDKDIKAIEGRIGELQGQLDGASAKLGEALTAKALAETKVANLEKQLLTSYSASELFSLALKKLFGR
mgnify:CR=1 FL=1